MQCYPISLLCTHPTSTTLFPILSKQSVLVLSFEYLMDNSIALPIQDLVGQVGGNQTQASQFHSA
jgi:hypothetical protein